VYQKKPGTRPDLRPPGAVPTSPKGVLKAVAVARKLALRDRAGQEIAASSSPFVANTLSRCQFAYAAPVNTIANLVTVKPWTPSSTLRTHHHQTLDGLDPQLEDRHVAVAVNGVKPWTS